MAVARAPGAPASAAPAGAREGRARRLGPELLRRTRAARLFVALTVALGTAAALLIVAQAWLIADVVSGAFVDHRGSEGLRGPLALLLVAVLARAVLAWAGELAAAGCAAGAKSEIRASLVRSAAESVVGSGRAQASSLAVLATRGIDALDDYFSLYLPQVLLAAIVPVVVVAAVLAADWLSAVIMLATIPLVPLFMALVGASTRERMDRQTAVLHRLGGHFLDVVAGLGTLKVFGRSRAQARAIERVTDEYRRTATSTLRVTFLSSLILELVATISVAMVAVAIGLRLMDGGMTLRAGLFALVLAPEAYLPLRRLGAGYHAGAEGAAAADRALAVIEASPPPAQAGQRPPDPGTAAIELRELTVVHPGRSEPSLGPLSLRVSPGETIAVCGPSGCGKSTLLAVLLGLRAPDGGSARISGSEIGDLDRAAWHAQLAWLPQHPRLFAASIADNVALGREGVSDEAVRAALAEAGLLETVLRRPGGLQRELGEGGAGLSSGERRRLALARVLVRDAPLLLLDEPTAGLDSDTEAAVVQSLRRAVSDRTAVIVTHRPAALELADRVVHIGTVRTAR